MCYFYTCIYRVRLPILFFINFRAYCSLFVYIFCFVSHILAIIVVVIMCGVCNIYFVANRIYVEIKYFDIVFYYNMNENRQIVRDNTHTIDCLAWKQRANSVYGCVHCEEKTPNAYPICSHVIVLFEQFSFICQHKSAFLCNLCAVRTK